MSTFQIVVSVVGGLMTIITFVKMIFGKQIAQWLDTKNHLTQYKFDKDTINNQMKIIEKDIEHLKLSDRLIEQLIDTNNKQSKDIENSKQERKLMLEALLGLCRREKEKGANGTVSGIIEKLENYMFNMAHK